MIIIETHNGSTQRNISSGSKDHQVWLKLKSDGHSLHKGMDKRNYMSKIPTDMNSILAKMCSMDHLTRVRGVVTHQSKRPLRNSMPKKLNIYGIFHAKSTKHTHLF